MLEVPSNRARFREYMPRPRNRPADASSATNSATVLICNSRAISTIARLSYLLRFPFASRLKSWAVYWALSTAASPPI